MAKELRPEQRARLIKLMQMTLSSNDHEALIAMRKANALLGHLNWEDVLLVKSLQPTVFVGQTWSFYANVVV